jgi:alanine dehydrogenase
MVENGAGLAAGMPDAEYVEAGAALAANPQAVFDRADMILKVKELLPAEFPLLREGQILFTYIHSANRPPQTQLLLDRKAVGIAYEDVMTDDGQFPLLTPMSEIAGEVGLLMGAYHLFTVQGGGGLMLGGAPGVAPAQVVVLGAGHAGAAAARSAAALGADVTILDIDLSRLREVRRKTLPNVKTLHCAPPNVERILPQVDLLVNAVKWSPGLTIVSRSMLKLMKRKALIVDIDCEPNGAIETCAYSTLDAPVFEVDGVRHICVPNLPSAVARTASLALANATLPYALEIADKGWFRAVQENTALRRGLDFAKGYLTFRRTAEAQGRLYTPVEEALAALAPQGSP